MKKLLCFLLALSAPGFSEEAQITLSSQQRRYFIGENVLLDFTIKNTGKQLLVLDVGGDYRGAPRSLRFKVEAFDETGHLVPDPFPHPVCFGGLVWKPKLKPGESFTSTLSLPRYRRIPGKGHFRIRASHDMGWKSPARAELKLDFLEPTPQQAAQVVSRQAALPLAESVTSGRPTPPYRDLWTLGYSCYLPALQKLGTSEALWGIGQIATPEATQALLECAATLPLRVEAARQISLRLPTHEPEEQFGVAERKYLARTSWTPHLRQEARMLAARLLQGSDQEVVEGAHILEVLGEQADLSLVAARLDHYLAPVSTYPRPAGPAYSLERAFLALHPKPAARGPWSPAWQLAQLRDHPSAEVIAAGLHSPSARVREQAVLAVSKPEAVQAVLLSRLQDMDPGVQVAACSKLRGNSAVLKLVRESADEWVLRAASQACREKLRWEACDILTERLRDKLLWRIAFDQLAEMIMTRPSGYSSDGAPDPDEVERLLVVWKSFLAQSRERIQRGETWPVLPAELVPHNVQMSHSSS